MISREQLPNHHVVLLVAYSNSQGRVRLRLAMPRPENVLFIPPAHDLRFELSHRRIQDFIVWLHEEFGAALYGEPEKPAYEWIGARQEILARVVGDITPVFMAQLVDDLFDDQRRATVQQNPAARRLSRRPHVAYDIATPV